MTSDAVRSPRLRQQVRFLDGWDRDDGEALRIEVVQEPGPIVPPHVHPAQEERFHVVAGDISLRIGRRRLRLGAGESAKVPPGTAHSFRVCGGEAALLINESRPPLDTKECFVETFELDRSADPWVRQAGRPDADRAEIPTRVSFTRRRGDLAHLRQHLTDISFDELIARAERQRILIEPFRHRAGEDALEVIRAGPDVGRQRAGAAPTA